jgi:hypothetical protein
MVAVRLPQPRHCAPHPQKKAPCPEKGAPLFLLLAVLGGVNCRLKKTFSKKEIKNILLKKNKKKKVKVSSSFKK